MPYKPYKRFIETQFNNNRLNWNSNVNQLKNIGNFFTQRLNALQIYNLQQLVEYVVNQVNSMIQGTKIRKFQIVIGQLTENARRHKCGINNYLIRPLNRFAFNTLVDLVDYAKTNLPTINPQHISANLATKLICNFNEGTTRNNNQNNNNGAFCQVSDIRGNVGDSDDVNAMRYCPCNSTQQSCQSNTNCKWHNRACIPRHTKYHRAAKDVPGYAGEWDPTGNLEHTRPNTRYVSVPHGPGRRGKIITPLQITQRCSATTQRGTRCRRNGINNTTLCHIHS